MSFASASFNNSSNNMSLHILIKQLRDQLDRLAYRPGLHSRNRLLAAGFQYTGDGDTARCDHCCLEVSGWTAEMEPFTIHSQRSPHCQYVLYIKAPRTLLLNIPPLQFEEKISENEANAPADSNHSSVPFIESSQLQDVRKRTFSHWPYDATPSANKMIKAGFFHCNIRDRVICIYCNLICEQWISNVDDPRDVHKILSPDCIYMKALLTHHGPLTIINANGSFIMHNADRPHARSNNMNSFTISRVVRPASSNNVPEESINDSIQASYVHIDKKTTVCCPQCRKAFRNLDSNEDPMIDHIRRFPHCSYARQTQQNSNETALPWDKKKISQMVRDRLKLPVSQALIRRTYPVSVVKQCWQEQLRIKEDDFVSDLDLKLACLILQKQCEQLYTERYVILPSRRISELRQRIIQAHIETMARIRAVSVPRSAQSINSEIMATCVVCLSENRSLAFLPCGHLCTCVPCGYSLNLCPQCRREKVAVILINT